MSTESGCDPIPNIKKGAFAEAKAMEQIMKIKKLTALIAAALTLSASMIGVSAKGLELTAAYGTPKLDGKLDNAYKNSSVYEVKYSGDASYSTAKLYYLWDETALYIYADVTDDTPSTKADTTNIGDIWKTDCIELGANLVITETGDPHKVSKGGVWLAAPLYNDRVDAYGALSELSSFKSGMECVTVSTDNGWAVEIKLPIFGDESDIIPKAGEKYGVYGILHNDTDNDNARNSITWHNSDNTGANYDVTLMDYIVLAEKPESKPEIAAQTADIASVALISCAAAAFVGIKAKRK